MNDTKKIIVALDFDDIDTTFKFIDTLNPSLCRLKIGKELFTKYGPDIIRDIHTKGFEIFLDLKFHDIPTTVYKACISAFSLNVWMLNIHLSGGLEMVKSAVKAKNDCQSSSKLIGVTALTSLSDSDCSSVYGCTRIEQIKRLKDIGLSTNIDGFVCSPYDIKIINSNEKVYVTPGIRIDDNIDDHHKVTTPSKAIELGSTYLVIGRSITCSQEPNKTLENIIKDL